ncbi:cytidine deaminase [Streptomyces sp. DSM 44915]|uniref:Cytidine deaminase n=1 Tax=Streptomyces chisholmiae TaxID=3075540 RepID=A0ABU2JUN2_9ACTN|nr:cytidine deaminase [Streptomyces sp. DSM 44915]MDT0268655.1 cytidine deaminase [Streptomyces sp. DSM 44915]
MSTPHPPRLALFGLPGAGKSTTGALLRRRLEERGARVAVVRIAAPLYDVQRAFHERAGNPLAEGRQDGALLNFLGSHFRTAAPGFLLADFEQRCQDAVLAGAEVLICDDARPVDLDEVAKRGFTLVRINAPAELRRARKSGRGDRTSGDDEHPTEVGVLAVRPHHEIDNAGDLDQLGVRVDALLAGLAGGPAEPGPPVGQGTRLDALFRRAAATITPRYAENRHQIGAAILAGDGRVFTGLHVEAMVGRASVCAEAVALGKAREADATGLRLVLAVRHPKPSEADRRIRPVPPCGLCRELLLDYGPDIEAVVGPPDALTAVPMADLLPHKYVGTKWKATRAVESPAVRAHG